MAISGAAKTNHDQLFGDRVSTLAQTDPELIEYFDNFAFDEVYADAARLDETLDLHTSAPGQSASTPQTRLEYGKAVQGRIAGDDAVAARLTGTPADEVHFQRYLAANCFGDTVGRGGIDLGVRELLTFSMLVALGGADAQVRGHVLNEITGS